MLLKKKTQSIIKINQNAQTKPKKTMASLRLQKDLAQYKQEQISFVKLSFPQQHNLQSIHVQIIPQQNSLYNNCCVNFHLQFPDTYPMDPPKLQCLNKIFHPNINYKGRVCLPLVRQDYSPTVTLTSIICGLIYVLTYPNADDALNPQIGDLMIKDYEMFKKIVEHTIEGRVFKNLEYDKIIVSNKNTHFLLHKKVMEQKQPVMKKQHTYEEKSISRNEKIQDLRNKLQNTQFQLEEK